MRQPEGLLVFRCEETRFYSTLNALTESSRNSIEAHGHRILPPL